MSYVGVKDANFISIPILAKYEVVKSFGLMAGPSLGFFTESVEGRKSFNYGITAGASYDVTENFILDARYDIGLANLFKDVPSIFEGKLSFGGFFVGVGYKF